MPWNNGTRKKKRYLTVLIWIVILTIFDQLSKIAADQFLKFREPFVLIRNVFQLEYLENRGAAFGILQNRQEIFCLITILALLGLTFLFVRMPASPRYRPMSICYVLFMAGALGNFIDRTLQGYVIDFFYFKRINFPIFNVADIYVTTAVILLLVLVLFYYKEEELDFIGRKK